MIVVHFCLYLWLVCNIVLGIIAKKSSYFVSWRQLQSWPPHLCLQSPENELFCFRFLYKMPTKKLICLLLKTASILPCPPPPYPPVSRRQKMSFFFLQVFLSWISFSRLRRAIIWYGRPVLHTCIPALSLHHCDFELNTYDLLFSRRSGEVVRNYFFTIAASTHIWWLLQYTQITKILEKLILLSFAYYTLFCTVGDPQEG